MKSNAKISVIVHPVQVYYENVEISSVKEQRLWHFQHQTSLK